MARGPIKRKDPQALQEIQELTRILATQKADAEREFYKNLELALEKNEMRRALAVRRAVEAGDTKAEIARMLGTTARIKVYEILEMTENLTVPDAKPVVTFPEPGRMVMVLTGESVPNYGEFTGELNFLWDEGFNEWDIDYDAEGINTKAANEILGVLLNPEHPEYKKWKDLVTR